MAASRYGCNPEAICGQAALQQTGRLQEGQRGYLALLFTVPLAVSLRVRKVTTVALTDNADISQASAN